MVLVQNLKANVRISSNLEYELNAEASEITDQFPETRTIIDFGNLLTLRLRTELASSFFWSLSRVRPNFK
jgi:hypothetical protein